VPGFEKINSAAYWDYQQSKVYVRKGKRISPKKTKRVRTSPAPSIAKIVCLDDRPECCVKCGSPKIWIADRYSHVKFDLRFTRRGARQSNCQFRYHTYKCGICGSHTTPYKAGSKYGDSLRSYVMYLLIEMRLSHEKISEHISTIFKVPITHSNVADIKHEMARNYADTYESIAEHLRTGFLINADETKGVVYGGGHYVWVLANTTSVFYVYSATREASVLHGLLGEFSGVLVSDFYSAYDSVECSQQKCLIHLMRDINEDMRKNPFNGELACIATKFSTLLRNIVSTIDRYGLKRFHLVKHKKESDRFIGDVAKLTCVSDTALALQRRIDKNKAKLFTFLDYNEVPWNNNTAEHAVRAFTRLRNVMGTSTASGTADYCVLLSIQQTLHYRGISFLDFLLSGQKDLAALAKPRGERTIQAGRHLSSSSTMARPG
jgi:Transposase IS66 family